MSYRAFMGHLPPLSGSFSESVSPPIRQSPGRAFHPIASIEGVPVTLWDETRLFRDIESFTFPQAWECVSERVSEQMSVAEGASDASSA